MKNIHPLLFVICALLALASKKKKNAPLFRGDYSFKTSGSVTAKRANVSDPAMFNITLDNEIGQLQIANLDRKTDDNKIFLRDFTKNTLLFTGDSISLKNEVRVSASGQMYEDNTLILNMIYEGEAETNERNFKIHGDNIRMAAIRN